MIRCDEASGPAAHTAGWAGLLAGLLAALPASGLTQSADDAAPVPDAMRRLQPLAGTWVADSVKFLDAEGEVRRVSGARSRNRVYLDGLAFHHEGRLEQPEIETQGWYYWDPEEDVLRMASVSSGGNYDEFTGRWDGDRLIMVTEPRAHYGGRIFRLITWDIRPDSFRERLEVSTDDGETWRVMNRQRFRRLNGPRRSGETP